MAEELYSAEQLELDLAYIAGLVDGEGCIRVKKTKPRPDCVSPSYTAHIHIRMVEESAIKFIHSILGGSYYKEKRPYENRRPLFCWSIHSRQAIMAIAMLRKYLKVKAEQADLLLRLGSLKKIGSRHKTKIVGTQNFPNLYGPRIIPSFSYSDEYIARLESLYLESRKLNRVGLAAMED